MRLSVTVIIYKGLLEGYNFDESLMQPLYIPGMEAPPPLPPKKRKHRRHGVAASQAVPSPSSRPMGQDTLSRRVEEAKRSSISDDMYVPVHAPVVYFDLCTLTLVQ